MKYLILLLLVSCAVEPTTTESTEWVVEPKLCPMYIQATNTPEQITQQNIYIYSNKVKIVAISSCDNTFLQKFLDDGYFWSWYIPIPGIINVYRNGEWLISNEIITYDNF